MRFAILALGIIVMPITACAETVRLYAAGSLKAALIDLTAAFEAVTLGINVETTLGA
jgi:ABC-type molybdate transport system substrate-binding protein